MENGINDYFQNDLQVLQSLERDDLPLPEPKDYYRTLLTLESECIITNPPVNLTITEEHQRRFEQGKPFLVSRDLSLDRKTLNGFFRKILDVAVSFFPDEQTEIGKLYSLAKDPCRLEEAVLSWFQARKSPATEKPEGLDALTPGVLQASLRPFLISHARHLWNRLKQKKWLQRICPVCGSRPDFALIDRERSARWLLCSCCDTPWLFLRIGCPYCNNQDHRSLFFFSDDAGGCRLYICKKCFCYIKAMDLGKNQAPFSVAVERILALPLDLQALGAGYLGG